MTTRAGLAVGLLASALALTACGPRIETAELEATNGIFTRSAAPAPDARTERPGASRTAEEAAPAAPVPVRATGGGAAVAAPAPPDGSSRSTVAAPLTPAGATAVNTGPRPAAPAASQAAAAAPAPEAGPVPVRAPVVLGSFGTASGVIGAQVAAIPPATRAWVADVNVRGGLAGHPVKVVFGDDRGDPQQALSLVRRMVEQDGAVAFVATYTVTTMDGVAAYLEQKNVPVIGATGGSEVEDTSPMIFNPTLGADHGIAWSYLLTIAAQTDKRKLSILYCREASTCQNQVRRIKELAPRLSGFSIVHEAQVSIVQPDYTAEVLAARNAGAEVVVTVMDAQSMIRVIRSAQRQGWKPIFSATHNLNSASFRTTDADLDGTLAASTTVPYTTSPRLAPYREAMQRYQPGAPLGGYGASAWAHALLVERLAAAWAEEKPGSADVLEALYGLRDETIGGLIVPITFNRGPHGAVNLCVVPIRYEDGIFRPAGGGDGTFTCPPGSRA